MNLLRLSKTFRPCSEPVLDQDDPGFDHGLLDGRDLFQELGGHLRRTETHHRFDARPVVPGAVEDDHLARRREVREITLDVHLRLLALGWRGKRHDMEHPRADPLGDAFDGAALAGRVAALEDDADLRARRLHPFLQGDQFTVQEPHFPLIFFRFHLGFGRGIPA